jgi:hypothetical protein
MKPLTAKRHGYALNFAAPQRSRISAFAHRKGGGRFLSSAVEEVSAADRVPE